MYPSTPIQKDRELFSRLKAKYGSENVVSPHYLRQDIPLENNKNRYEAKFLAENGQLQLPEQVLSRTDKFAVTRAGIFLLRQPKAKPGTGVLQTYPNTTVFPNNTSDLEVIYNGNYGIRINQVVVLEGFPTRDFRVVGETQQGVQGAVDSNRHPAHGTVNLPPNITLDGAHKNSFFVDIPSFAGIQLEDTAETHVHKLVFFLKGFLIEGASTGSFRS